VFSIPYYRPKQITILLELFFSSIQERPSCRWFSCWQRWTLHLNGYSTQGTNKLQRLSIWRALQLPVTEAEKPTSVYFGSWLRLNDAVIPYLGLEFSDFLLVPLTMSILYLLKTASQSRGGIEISILHQNPSSRGITVLNIKYSGLFCTVIKHGYH